MRLGSRDRSGPELLDDRLTWQNRAVGQLLGIAASDQRMPTGHTQVQIFHADSLRSSFLTIRPTTSNCKHARYCCGKITTSFARACGVTFRFDILPPSTCPSTVVSYGACSLKSAVQS